MVNQFLFLTFYFKGSRRISSPDVKSQRHGVLRNVSCPGEQRQRSPSTRSTHSEPTTPFQHSFSVTSIGSNLPVHQVITVQTLVLPRVIFHRFVLALGLLNM